MIDESWWDDDPNQKKSLRNRWEWLNKQFSCGKYLWKWFKSKEIVCLITEPERHWKAIFHLRVANKGKLFQSCLGIRKWYSITFLRWNLLQLVKSCHWLQHQHKCQCHGSKTMLYLWRRQKGVVYYELLKFSNSITVVCYKNLIPLSRTLRKSCSKNKAMANACMVTLAAKVVKIYLQTSKWVVFTHPQYSPDLAPSD